MKIEDLPPVELKCLCGRPLLSPSPKPGEKTTGTVLCFECGSNWEMTTEFWPPKDTTYR